MAAAELSIEGSPSGVAGAARAFDAFSRQHALPGEASRAAQVALDEILSNAVKAGFEAENERRIDLSFEVADGVLELVVRYDGPAFDPLARKDPDTQAALEERPVGGLGIYFVKKLMDGVDYQRTGNTNCLRMRKRINA